MKKLICILIISVALSLIVPAFATDAVVYVNDLAGLLNSDEEQSLNVQMNHLSHTYNLIIRIKTVDSLEGKTAQRYADDYYDANMIDLASGNGILLIVSMSEREWAVTTNGQTHQVVTNSDIDDIMADVLPDLSEGNYYAAFCSFVSGVELEYDRFESGAEDGELDAGQILLIALLIGAISGGVTLLAMRSTMQSARPQRSAVSYLREGSYHLTQHGDFYLYSNTKRTPKPKNNTSVRSGGGSRGGRSGRF